MTKHALGRAAEIGSAFVLAFTTLGVACAFAASAGEFAAFAGCPLSNPFVQACFVSKTVGGSVKLGSSTVPLVHPLTIQGGFIENEEGEQQFVDAPPGYQTLSRVPQSVPGGLQGLFACNEVVGILARACNLASAKAATGVTATAELAGPPAPGIGLSENSLLAGVGTVLSLPVKVKLENPLLGEACYIGSAKQPITFNLTVGSTAEKGSQNPILGSTGKIVFKGEGLILAITGTRLVDNTFTAPAATGCGEFGLFDALIDRKLGLPAKPGASGVELRASTEQAGVELVREYL